MASPFLATKLFLPPARPRERHVARTRLEARLVEGLARPLTLVSAPAGFGKTTLVAECLASRQAAGQVRVGWLSLDEDDNDPARFLAYLVAALHRAEPAVAEAALALLHSAQPPSPPAILSALINDLAARAEGPGLILALDDYHLIRQPSIHAALAFLVDRLPPALRLVLMTRADPPLPLARWRVRDQLAEVRIEELRFAPAEAAAFLNQVMGLGLGPEDIAALQARTEGWVAGLQLAALSLRGREDTAAFVRAFANSPLVVVDYLAEEVLQREPQETQAFLLQTSILERLSGALVGALTGRADGPAMLEQLRQRNLFVSALDDERQWYRYHHLFADVLRARLRQTRPAEERELHRRAGLKC